MVLRALYISFGVFLLLSCNDPGVSNDSTSDEKSNVGTFIYNKSCVACHGDKGDLGAGGATDLTASVLSKDSIMDIIKKGRGGMPPQDHLFANDGELEEIAEHVIELRK